MLISFLLVQLAPGGPAEYLIGQSGGAAVSPQYVASLRAQFGLDRPWYIQLISYYHLALTLQFGVSFQYGVDVWTLLRAAIPNTLLLMGVSIVLSTAAAVFLGIETSRRPGSKLDKLVSVAVLSGYSMPVFWLGQLLILLFSSVLTWLPTQGMVSVTAPESGFGHLLDIGRHLVLPAFAYGVYQLALVLRMMRAKAQDILSEDFVTTARAKGASVTRVLYHHVLPNALPPVVMVIGVNFGFLLAGSVLTETVFGWPGMGRLLYQAIIARDFPVIQAVFVLVGVSVIIANLAADVVVALLDPRVLATSTERPSGGAG